MKPQIQLGSALFALTVVLAAPAKAITVVASSDANALTSTLLGPGITLVGTPTLVHGPTSAGTFTNGLAAGIGINSGVVLTSGSVNFIDSLNSSDSSGEAFGGPGDASLNALLSGSTTRDATSLTFNFTTSSGAASFRFVFGSEEYNEYANSTYNDVFGFFLDGTNIALLPGTSTPISINNVNGGEPFGTNAQNPEYYVNNDDNDGGGGYAFEYDGFTKVFSVGLVGLDTGVTHTIKLAIADVGDYGWDSGVFIEAGSFTEAPPGVPDSGSSIVLCLLGLASLAVVRRRR